MVQPIKNFFSWRKKCCQLPFRSWCGRPATMFQKLPEKNTIITKEPNVSSWDLGDGRYIVVSRIFCLRRFCSYTVHPRKKKKDGKIRYKLFQSLLFYAMYLMDISTLPTLPQNTGGEHIYTILEMDGQGAECMCVPTTGSRYIHLASKSCLLYYWNAMLHFTLV